MPSNISRLADFLPYLLALTSNAVSARIASEYERRFGLKAPEWRVMAVLGDAGALIQRDIVGATLMDKVAVNRACKLLEKRALVRRSPNAQDGRSHHLELTPEGIDVHWQIMSMALAMEARVFDALTETERREFKTMLGRLRVQVQELDVTE